MFETRGGIRVVCNWQLKYTKNIQNMNINENIHKYINALKKN